MNKEIIPDLNLLYVFIWNGVQHCIVFQVENLVYAAWEKNNKKDIYHNQEALKHYTIISP